MERPIQSRARKTLFHVFSWGRPSNNTMLGVQLLVSHSLLLHAHVHTQFDPPWGLHGRLGGARLVSREAGMEMDDLFISAYAP